MVSPGGLRRGCTGPARSCATWTLTVCTPSESEAAGTPCSAPSARRSPSTHRLHLVSVRDVTFILTMGGGEGGVCSIPSPLTDL